MSTVLVPNCPPHGGRLRQHTPRHHTVRARARRRTAARHGSPWVCGCTEASSPQLWRPSARRSARKRVQPCSLSLGVQHTVMHGAENAEHECGGLANGRTRPGRLGGLIGSACSLNPAKRLSSGSKAVAKRSLSGLRAVAKPRQSGLGGGVSTLVCLRGLAPASHRRRRRRPRWEQVSGRRLYLGVAVSFLAQRLRFGQAKTRHAWAREGHRGGRARVRFARAPSRRSAAKRAGRAQGERARARRRGRQSQRAPTKGSASRGYGPPAPGEPARGRGRRGCAAPVRTAWVVKARIQRIARRKAVLVGFAPHTIGKPGSSKGRCCVRAAA